MISSYVGLIWLWVREPAPGVGLGAFFHALLSSLDPVHCENKMQKLNIALFQITYAIHTARISVRILNGTMNQSYIYLPTPCQTVPTYFPATACPSKQHAYQDLKTHVQR